MICEGTVAKSWEPYTGGKPSPSPDYPQEIQSVGDGGNISVIVKNPDNEQMQSVSFSTPNGLPGIPVSSGGNYTDENGQQWICDEVNLERGVYVQRVKKSSISDVTWRMNNANKHEFATEALHNIANKSYRYVNGLCDMYNVVVSELERFTDKSVIFGIDGYQIFVCDSKFGTHEEIK